MPEDDLLIPRSSNSLMPDAGTRPADEAAKNLRIDPKVLEERRRRKEALAHQPKTLNSDKDEPWRYMDRRISEAFPAFEELMWTLGDTARWVAERTREAVDGLSIDDERLHDIVQEIQDALAAGEIRAWAHTPNDPVPRELPRETWAVYQLTIEHDFLLQIIPFRSSSSADDERVLLDIRVSREDVLGRWPDAQSAAAPRELTTVGSANACRLWLVNVIKSRPNNPSPKETVRQEAKERFPKLGKRGFDRAWAAAIGQTGAEKWSAPGRRS
jgi:hypothetical protein